MKNLHQEDAILLGNFEIEIWEENQQVLGYMTNQWLVSWAIGKYLREIHPANCNKKEKEESRKTNLLGIEAAIMICLHHLEKFSRICHVMDKCFKINSSKIQ